MKFILENVMLIVLVLASGGMLVWPLLQRGSGAVANVEPADAVLLINRSNAIVLDVRDDAEFAAGHIADARHIPLAELDARLKDLEKYKSKPILVHCQSGVRSRRACTILHKHAFTSLHNLQGGLNAWTAAKLPVVKGSAA